MQVPPALTPSTAADVAGAIVWAYEQLRGHAPAARESWLYPLALSANETDSWRAMWNWNAGNVTTSGAGSQWMIIPGTSGFRYLSFTDLRSGALSMLRSIDAHGGLDAADAGDLAAFQVAADKYLGSPYPPLGALVQALSATKVP